ncbi:MAG: aconitate hydratase AcnA, partial [Proteobacteria bacterium]|nr:aconitate hydratase AcnA [Pseudomonadota bacterium]
KIKKTFINEFKDASSADGSSLSNGSVVIASITSCTNTSNPNVLIGAGLLAKKAVERGLSVKPWVKTSFAPGSKAAINYLKAAELMPYLEALKFHLVAYGCTTCIGNSGPLSKPVADTIKKHNLVVASVISGNRNFEGRISPLTRANFLASPPLVIAFAISGKVTIDFAKEPIALDNDGKPVYLHEIWPSTEEIKKTVKRVVRPEMYKKAYENAFEGSNQWQALPVPEGTLFNWDPKSTYIKEPPFLKDLNKTIPELQDIKGARILALLGDSVTTDHISPAGAIPVDSPAGAYLIDQGLTPSEFNSFGSRRGNHEVMLRGTFGNIRLKNKLVPGIDGGWTVFLPDGKKMTIYEAAMQYQKEATPLLIIAGKNYGTGSSRDWAAKGTYLLGIKAVIAESFERIHRSNLICMGILPLQFKPGENHKSLDLDGTETYEIAGIENKLEPLKELTVFAQGKDSKRTKFRVIARIDSPIELNYYRHGGILAYVLRRLL